MSSIAGRKRSFCTLQALLEALHDPERDITLSSSVLGVRNEQW